MAIYAGCYEDEMMGSLNILCEHGKRISVRFSLSYRIRLLLKTYEFTVTWVKMLIAAHGDKKTTEIRYQPDEPYQQAETMKIQDGVFIFSDQNEAGPGSMDEH